MYITKKKTSTVNSQKRYSVNIIYIRRRYKREIIWKNTSFPSGHKTSYRRLH